MWGSGECLVNGDGTGDAILQFHNGESITLTGVDPAMLNLGTLRSMSIPCFTAGALIFTVDGKVPAEGIRVGDEVVTRDHGGQKVRWVGLTLRLPQESVKSVWQTRARISETP